MIKTDDDLNNPDNKNDPKNEDNLHFDTSPSPTMPTEKEGNIQSCYRTYC